MITIILLAAALSSTPDTVFYRATVRPESAVFEFPLHDDPAWTIGKTAKPADTPQYEWTVSAMAGDTVFSFGYLLYNDTAAPAGARKFADARSRGEKRLFANGSADPSVNLDIAFEASRVVIRLNDPATIRRIFALKPALVQFSSRVAGGLRETIDIPVDYGENVVVSVVPPPPVQSGEPPDSTYLRLVMDFPALSTFWYDVVSPGRLVSMHTEIRAVVVSECMLSFEVWSQRTALGAPSSVPSFGQTVAIPLKAIDPKSLIARPQHPQRNLRYDPQPWLLQVAVKRDTQARIMVGSTETTHKAGTSMIDIDVRDREAGVLLGDWLTDAAQRCATWKTTPMKPIR